VSTELEQDQDQQQDQDRATAASTNVAPPGAGIGAGTIRQVAQNYRSGELVVLDVPPPACKPGGVLVRTLYSLISTGTEMMKVNEARLSLVGKARARPDQVKKVLDSMSQNGPVATYKKAMSTLDSYTPLGYSLCGVVVEVGAGAEEFAVGDLVAAAGNEFALHAELNWVPKNLCVPVPDGVSPEHAAFATVGAIAMQGVRRGEVQIGETACVIGLGLIGQLVVRLLVASGVRVVGVDTVPDRCRMAEAAGATACAAPDAEGTAYLASVVAQMTGGLGADHVYLAAGGDSNGPVELAARIARDRAKVVDIGKTRLDLPWNAYYEKELDVRFSRSYGPGRYDDTYELAGVDYPAGYVRWTERRNLQCFLDLLAEGAVDVGPLVSGTRQVDEAAALYTELRDGSLHGIGFLFAYPRHEGTSEQVAPVQAPPARARNGSAARPTVAPPTRRRPSSPPRTGAVRLGFVGAGNYAGSMLLPHLAKNPFALLATVATTRSLSAVNAQRKFGFGAVTTDASTVLADPEIDAVFVVTRHHSHADFVCRALEHGKAVFVEKPLALTLEDVDRVVDTVARTGNDRLMVGFNRRFAPLFTDMRRRFGTWTGPVSARYLVNAGRLDPSSWYLDEGLEGSRFLGEGGHFLDTVAAWVGHPPVEVTAHQTGNGHDLHALVRYADGSLATITYATDGNAKFPKETFDVCGGGRSARLDNFTRATVWSPGGKDVKRSYAGQDKGQRAEVGAFVDAVLSGGPMPIGLDSLVATTRATIAVGQSIASGVATTL
jgi:predicted dehydrogenase/threonine dehydrogenase-like Zn-dependent dehydrogenase